MQTQRLAVIDLGGQDAEVELAVDALREQGIDVESVPPDDAVETLRTRPPVLTVVHAHTLTVDTLDLLRLLGNGSATEQPPVVVLSDSLSDEEEMILLHGGALQVIGLPMPARLLQARIAALYAQLSTRTGREQHDVLAVDNVVIDPRRREVTVDGEVVELTKTEFDLLRTLARDPSAVVSRQRLMHDVDGGSLRPRSLESHLSRLRLKITAAGGPRLIESVRGVGYRLKL